MKSTDKMNTQSTNRGITRSAIAALSRVVLTKGLRVALAVLAGLVAFTQPAISAQPRILWVTENSPEGFSSGPVFGFNEEGWGTLLQNAGYTVDSYDPPNALLSETDLATINSYDLIIIGRSVSSGNFQDSKANSWNTRISKPLLTINAFAARNTRLGWMTLMPTTPNYDSAVNGMPTPITAVDLTDPMTAVLFQGVSLNGNTTADPYDEAFDRNTSHFSSLPVPGGRVLANADFTDFDGISREDVPVIVEFPMGTAVRDRQDLLGGYRMYFAAGSREPLELTGNVPIAGKENLTATGEALFLRAVAWAMQPRGVVSTGPVQGPNGHVYELVFSPGITWNTAKALAEQKSFDCFQGHLATITSQEEDVFLETLRTTFVGDRGLSDIGEQEVWVGGFQLVNQTTQQEGWSWINDEGAFPGVNDGSTYANWLIDRGMPDDAPAPGENNEENHLGIGLWGLFGWNDEGKPHIILGYIVEYDGSETPVAACQPTTNPSGKNAPGKGGNQSGNPDGFWQLLATDNCDAPLQIFVADSASSFVAGPFANGDRVKITQAPGVQPNQKPGAGVMVAHIQLKGDALVYAVDSVGNSSQPQTCLVPPLPK